MKRFLRHIAPIVLLATYLPMVALSSLHVHHDTTDAIDECQQCSGHVEAPHNHHHDCQFCNFLSLSYLVQDCGQTVDNHPATERISTPTQSILPQIRVGVVLLRAPPVA